MTRTVGRWQPRSALFLAGSVYFGFGLALPLALGLRTPLLTAYNMIGVTLAWAITLAPVFVRRQADERRHLLEWTTNLRLLSAVEFERLVGELFRSDGWSVEEAGRHDEPDGGIDLRVTRPGREMLIQCKRWTARSVGVDVVRELGGCLLRDGLSGKDGIVVTSSEFTAAAVTEATRLGITIIDGRELICRLQKAGATNLLHRDTSHTLYACPQCGTRMLLSQSSKGYWLRCPRYRDGCGGKHDLDPNPQRALDQLMRFH